MPNEEKFKRGGGKIWGASNFGNACIDGHPTLLFSSPAALLFSSPGSLIAAGAAAAAYTPKMEYNNKYCFTQ